MPDQPAEPALDYQSPPPAAGPPKGAMMTIFLIAMMDFLGFGIIIPLLPRLIPAYKENAMKVTLIFSVYSVCQFIGAPILGAMSDRFGRRPVLVISQFGSAIGYLLLGVAPAAGAFTLVLVYISRVIDGFTGGNISTAQAYISDVTTPENRAKGMGMLGAAFGIGFSLGPAMGGILGYYGTKFFGDAGLGIPAYVAAALAALAAFMSWSKLTEGRSHKPAEAEVWLHPRQFLPIIRNGTIVQFLALSFCIMAAFVMMESTLVLFLDSNFHLSELGTGLFFGWTGFCIVAIQGGLVGKLSKRGGEWPMAIVGPLFVAGGMALFTLCSWWASVPITVAGLILLLSAGAINATGRSLQQPATSALLSKYSDPSLQGKVFGAYHGLSSLARVVGPIVAGLTYELGKGTHWEHTCQFITAGIIAIGVAVWTAALQKSAGKPKDPAGFPVVALAAEAEGSA